MGVPKFFRYISERYPCLSELVKEHQIPEFDNLYLDMNGIIHNCSHPNDMDVHFRISEEQIFSDIFHYIDSLFRMIQPKKLFFMAVDGVAPRAKMNQQRGRRFRSAKDAEIQEKKAREKGEVLPTEDRFDSNCITPGTPFMARLNEALKYFIKYKITTNKLWQNCRVVLSGHQTPGEGEHKIMDYIRYLKVQPGFDANTRHCLYGLDADLVMLGLCTHEHHFSLLREEVKFGKNTKRVTSVDEIRFYLLHLGLLKEYLELEFAAVKDKISFPYDIEHIVDDWVLMGFLVGNDFIPHLPNLHITSNALPLLYTTYIKVLPTLDGYINEKGTLNLKRLETFFEQLALVDAQLFIESGADFTHINSKNEAFDFEVEDESEKLNQNFFDGGLEDLIASSGKDFNDDADDDFNEFASHKRHYYRTKLNYPEMTAEVLEEQTECYIRALQWTLSYYYHGIQSWSWFYPHHYAPYMSDVKNFKHLELKYDVGKPFLPFEQLMAVLPAASNSHLPEPYRNLMTDPLSPIIDYYPVELKTDLNGKTQEWEAVVLIPFIDEKKLLATIRPCVQFLSDEEKSRNAHGPMFQYDHSNASSGPMGSKFGLKHIERVFCKEVIVNREEVFVPVDELIIGPSKNALKDVYFPGFPTMKHLKYTAKLSKARVKVFDNVSRNENMILKVCEANNEDGLGVLPTQLINKEVYVDWPHLSEAKLVQVSNKYAISSEPNSSKPNDSKLFETQSKAIKEHYKKRLGIDVGEINTLVHVLLFKGREYEFGQAGKMSLVKVWSTEVLCYPLQTLVKDIKIHQPKLKLYKNVEDVFVKKSTVFMLSTPYYGNMGEVVDPTLIKKCGRIKVNLKIYSEPNFSNVYEIHSSLRNKYMNTYQARSLVGISQILFSRITGALLVVPGMKRSIDENTSKINIGLSLKFPKNNEEIMGYSKKMGNTWYFSQETVNLVNRFYEAFPELFDNLSKPELASNDYFFESELFPDKVGQNMIDDISKWIKLQPHSKAEKTSCGTQTVEKETIEAILTVIDTMKKHHIKEVTLQVKPHLLYKPGLQISSKPPDPNVVYKLFDRVIMSRDLYLVPLGLIGTIIGIHHFVDPNPVKQQYLKSVDVFYDVLFDKEFDDGGSICGIADKRVFRVSQNSLINLSYGNNKSYNFDSKIDDRASTENSWRNPLNVNPPKAILDKNRYSASTNSHEKTEKDTNFSQIWNLLKNDETIKTGKITVANRIVPEVHNQSKIETDKITETDFLKKMLGLQTAHQIDVDNSVTINKKNIGPSSLGRLENENKISVDEIFKMHNVRNLSPPKPSLTNLPQPPSNWRQEASFKNINVVQNKTNKSPPLNWRHAASVKENSIEQSKSNKSPSPNWRQDSIKNSSIVQNKTTKSYFHRPQAIPLSPENDLKLNMPNSSNSTRPNGPQNLSNNNAYPAGHGAFIPLQAIRNKKPNQQQPTSHYAENIHQNNEIITKICPNFIRAQLSTTEIEKDIEPIKNTNAVPVIHTLRPSRIAAKFQIPHK